MDADSLLGNGNHCTHMGTFSYVPIADWHFCWNLFGGASRDRTDDLIVANDALSQLSYSPTVRV
jgi:hypothetical protein